MVKTLTQHYKLKKESLMMFLMKTLFMMIKLEVIMVFLLMNHELILV